MGLLDAFNTDDARLGIGLLAAAGPSATPMGFGQRLQSALGALDANKLQQKKLGLLDAQMDNLKSESASRQAALAKQQALQDYLSKLFGDGGAAAAAPAGQGQLGSGTFGILPTSPGQPAITQGAPAGSGGSRIGNLSIDQVVGLHALGGPNLLDAYKWVKDPLELKAGSTYQDRVNGRREFIPKVGEGIAPDATGNYGPLPGYASGQAAIEGAKTDATERAKAGYDVVKVYNPATQREEYVSRAQIVGRPTAPAPAAPESAPAMPVARSGVQGAFTGDPASVQAAISAIRDPQERANAQAAFEQQARSTPGFAGGANFAAGPSAGESASAAAARATAEGVAKDVVEQRKSIMNAGFVAPSNIARYQRIGKLLQDVDGGTLTATGTNLASLANSLGLKIDKNLPNKEAAASLANAAALELRNPAGGAGMPGAMSDQDRAFLSSMTPNMSQTAQGRKLVIDTYVSVQQRNQQVATFARNYEKKYGKLDNGFFEQLQSWSNANPLFKGQ